MKRFLAPVFLVLLLLWPAQPRAQGWDIVNVVDAHHGPIGLTDATRYEMDVTGGDRQFRLPDDPADLFGCVSVQKADNTSNVVLVTTPNGTTPIGGWNPFALILRGKYADICSDGEKYTRTGDSPSFSLSGGHRTFPVNQFGLGCDHHVDGIRDRGEVIRISMSAAAWVCNGSTTLPAPQDLGWVGGAPAYLKVFVVDVMVLDLPGVDPGELGEYVEVFTDPPWLGFGGGASWQPSLILDQEGEVCTVIFDSANWRTHSCHVPGGT